MHTAEQLLIAIVEAEERGVQHWESCEACQRREQCVEGKRVLGESLSAALTAKLYVDRARGRIPA